MTPKSLGTYTNRHNEQYSITLHYPIVPREADYWGYFYEVAGPMGLRNTFKGFILRSAIPTQELADGFAESGDLFEQLKQLLDLSQGGWSPITLPDMSRGYGVM